MHFLWDKALLARLSLRSHFGLARFVYGLLIANSMGVGARAVENPCLERAIAVSVLTSDGKPVKGLGLENFRCKVNRRPVDVLSVTCDTGPRRVVIVLDASGSEGDNWKFELAVAQTLVSQAEQQTSFALVTFADQVQEKASFSEGRQGVMDRLSRLKNATPKGKTALRDAMMEAVRMLSPASVGDGLIVISDGNENQSHTEESELRRALVAAGVRVFAFMVAAPLPIPSRIDTPEETLEQSVLKALELSALNELVETTGGVSVSAVAPVDPDRAVSAVRYLEQPIAEFYRLELRLPEPLEKPGKLKVEVIDPTRAKRPNVRIYHPQQLPPCSWLLQPEESSRF